jgi:hypothetical protein
MNYLLPPLSGQVSVSIGGYPQVNADSDGIFRVDNENHANALIRQCGFRVASGSDVLSASGHIPTISANVVEEETAELHDFTKDELRDWLTSQNVVFDKTARKDELLEIAQNHVNSMEEDEE